MKKAPLTVKHQARRTRALARFSIRPQAKGEDQASYDAYDARKRAEYASLKARLGV